MSLFAGSAPAAPERCPCGSGAAFTACCRRFHEGLEPATAAELMRARYSAFAVRDVDYLIRTWHPRTRPDRLSLDPQVTWTGLRVVEVLAGGPDEATGVVEFQAHYRADGRAGVQRERSLFERRAGRWFYLDADDREH